MKLRAPLLEKAIRRSARHEMRLNKEAWQDYKRHRKGWVRRQFAPVNVAQLFLFLIFLLLLISRGAHILLVAIALYATATAIFRGLHFSQIVLGGYDRLVLLHLPVSDPDFLKHEWKRFGWSWGRAFILFLAAFAVCTPDFEALFSHSAAVVLAALCQALCGLSLAIWLLAFVRNSKAIIYAGPFYLVALACAWLPAPYIDFLWSAIVVTPGGWVAHYFAGILGASTLSGLPLLIPILVVSLSSPIAFRFAHSRLLQQLEEQTGAGDLPVTVDASEGLTNEVVQEQTLDATPPVSDLELSLLRSAMDWRPDWKGSGWIEWIVGGLLSEEQKVVAEFMLAQRLGQWSRRWHVAAAISAIGVAATMFAPLPPWLLFLPVAAAASLGAPLLGGLWPGFHGMRGFGLTVPTYATVPVGYGQVSRVMFKTNMVRILAWAPLIVAYAAALSLRTGNTSEFGLLAGMEIVVLVLAVQPVMVLGHFSMGTNDSRSFNRHTVFFLCCGLFLLVVALTLGFAFFLVEPFWIKFLCVLSVFGCSWAAWASYGFLLNRGRIDLLMRPQ